MKAHVYQLKCLTNLHVGSGDENYHIVDAQVERDPVTEMPTIFSSGVKGAIREFLEQEEKKNPVLKEIIWRCLGGEKKTEETKDGKTTKKTVTHPGTYRFLAAQFIARPLRISKGNGTYVLTGVKECLEDYMELLEDLGVDVLKGSMAEFENMTRGQIFTNKSSVSVEGYHAKKVAGNTLMEHLIGPVWAVTDKETMKEFSLPVQARNVLNEKGISENLWYEEVVPHKSLFHMVIITPDEVNELDPYLDGKVVQFGADASIGYGLCKVSKLN